MRIKKERIARILFYILPIAYLAPPRIRIFNIQINWFEALFLFALLLLGIGGISGMERRTKYLVRWLLFLGVVTFISNLYGIAIIGYDFNLKNYSFIKYLPMYIGAIGLGMYLSEKQNYNKIAVLCLICLALMVYGYVLYPNFRYIVERIYGAEEHSKTYRIFFIANNPLGITMMATIFLIFASRNQKFWIQSVLYALGLSCALLAGSRSGLFVLSTFFIMNNINEKRKIVPLLIAVLFAISTISPEGMSEVITKRLPRFRISYLMIGIEDRLIVFRRCLPDFYTSPLFGTGYRTTLTRTGQEIQYHSIRAFGAHNQYISMLSNHGLVGFLVFIGFLGYVARRLLFLRGRKKIFINDFYYKRNFIFYRAVFITYLIAMLGWETFYLPAFTSFFLMCFAQICRESYSFQRKFSDYR